MWVAVCASVSYVLSGNVCTSDVSSYWIWSSDNSCTKPLERYPMIYVLIDSPLFAVLHRVNVNWGGWEVCGSSHCLLLSVCKLKYCNNATSIFWLFVLGQFQVMIGITCIFLFAHVRSEWNRTLIKRAVHVSNTITSHQFYCLGVQSSIWVSPWSRSTILFEIFWLDTFHYFFTISSSFEAYFQ